MDKKEKKLLWNSLFSGLIGSLLGAIIVFFGTYYQVQSVVKTAYIQAFEAEKATEVSRFATESQKETDNKNILN